MGTPSPGGHLPVVLVWRPSLACLAGGLSRQSAGRPSWRGRAGLPMDKGSVAVEAQRGEVGQPYGSCLLREDNGSPARPAGPGLPCPPAGRNWPARGAAAARPPSQLLPPGPPRASIRSTDTAATSVLCGLRRRPQLPRLGRCLAGLNRWRRLPATRSSHRGYPAPRQPARTSRLRLARSDEGERTAA